METIRGTTNETPHGLSAGRGRNGPLFLNINDWPPPEPYAPGELEPTGLVDSGTLRDPLKWETDSWKDQLRGHNIQRRYFNFWKSPDFTSHHDVKFSVGPTSERLTAHSLVLLLKCDNEEFRRNVMSCKDAGTEVLYPDLNHGAFEDVLHYIYSDELKMSSDAMSVYKVARAMGLHTLQEKLSPALTASMTRDNVLEMFCDALNNHDELLAKRAADLINRNSLSVIFSEAFTQLSQENLYQFLHSDAWHIDDEVQVFKAVMDWAQQKLSQMSQPEGTARMYKVREVIGRAFYEIRFTSLKNPDILYHRIDPQGILMTTEERNQINSYIVARTSTNSGQQINPVPTLFNVNERFKKERQCSIGTPSEIRGVTENLISESNNSPKEIDVGHEDEEVVPDVMASPPPPKKRKSLPVVNGNTSLHSERSNPIQYISPPSPVSPRQHIFPISPPSPSSLSTLQYESKQNVISLNDLIKRYSSIQYKNKVETINQEVRLSVIPHEARRVYLPNLKHFQLKLITRDFDCGSALKSHLKSKFAHHLANILFFDTIQRSPETQIDSKLILRQLLQSKVNVDITCENSIILRINHDEGVLLLNYVKDTQEILNGASDFPLKVLAVDECELQSLNHLNKNDLETIVMRRVKGLSRHADFLKSCTNLRTVCWQDLGNEEISFTEDIFRSNPQMSKLALSKCQLSIAGNWCDENYLQELILDNCTFKQDLLKSFPKLFPFVKRVQLYGKKSNATNVFSILEMESLQWLFVWEYNHEKFRISKSKTKLTSKSQQIQDFLAKIFTPEFARKEKITFLLEKRATSEEAPCTSSTALQRQEKEETLDPSLWIGTKFVGNKDKYAKITELDFKNFAYDTFFLNFEAFSFIESNEPKKRKLVQEPTPRVELPGEDNHIINTN